MITFTKATTLNFCSLSTIWTCDNFIYGIIVVFVAEDSKLRKTILKLAVKETKFLHSIGTAQMEYEIQRKVLKLIKEQHEALTANRSGAIT
jgi:hypothetical protein